MAATLEPKTQPETLVMFVYPSIAADGVGRFMGRWMNRIPLPFTKNVTFSGLVLGLIFAPFGALFYVLQKIFGQKYVLTNRSLQVWSSIGQRLIGSVPLEQIDEIAINQKNGQEFFRAADLQILDKGGNAVMTLAGVPRADVFRHTILRTRDAHTQVEAALATIGARSAG